MDWHLPFTLQDSSFIEVGVNPNVEVIRRRSRSTAAAASTSTPGRYEFNEYFVLANTNARGAVLVQPALLASATFYDGYRRNYTRRHARSA